MDARRRHVNVSNINYAFWGALLLLKLQDPTVLWRNTVYCVVWVVHLGSHWSDVPWRGKVHLADGSWAKVPVMWSRAFLVLRRPLRPFVSPTTVTTWPVTDDSSLIS